MEFRKLLGTGKKLSRELTALRLAAGRSESRRVRETGFAGLREAEFQVFSQWGEDGIIQWLLGKVPIENPVFVEFGVEDYSQSNTRFLLCNDNWSGLILDAGTAHQQFLADEGLSWKYTIDAVSSFVTRENINALIGFAGLKGDIGLLSIDIDGNDYWLLEAIEVVSPRILIVEYNSTFGVEHAISVPYAPRFDRKAAHFSHLYYGASLPALCEAASRKGYAFVGGNSAGNNAFFVRRDVLGPLRPLEPREGYVASKFRESRDARGRLTYLSSHRDRLQQIAELPVIRVPGKETATLRELFGL